MSILHLFILGLTSLSSLLSPFLGEATEIDDSGLVQEVAFNEKLRAMEVIHDEENREQILIDDPGLVQEVAFNEEERALKVIHDEENREQILIDDPGLVQEVALNEEERALEVLHDGENRQHSLPMLLNKKVTDREMRAITKQNCSVAYLTFHDEKELEVPNAEAACVVALWFQGNYPNWMETTDLIQEMVDANKSRIKKLAEQVCPCGVIDVEAECPEDVLNAMNLITNQCKSSNSKDFIRFWSETNNGIVEIDEATYRERLR